MKIVLFACVHNAGRSQMAAALFNQFVDPSKARAISAGTQPERVIHPEVIEVMQEMEVDLSKITPQLLTDELARRSDLLITMGCGESCPVVPGLQREDWPLEDPKGKSLDKVREIRNEVCLRIQRLIGKKRWKKP